MEDEDDLPPAGGEPEEPTAADSVGQLFGATLWIILFIVVAGAIGYAVMRWM